MVDAPVASEGKPRYPLITKQGGKGDIKTGGVAPSYLIHPSALVPAPAIDNLPKGAADGPAVIRIPIAEQSPKTRGKAQA